MSGKYNTLTPLGFCQCGCGQRTAIAKYDDIQQGYVSGTTRSFIQGHYHRWKTKHVDSAWGKKSRDRCEEIAVRVSKEITPERWAEVVGPAFEGAMSVPGCAMQSLVADLEDAAREAIRRHFASQVSYGRVSLDYMKDNGYEPTSTMSEDW